jgi:hypothetical protein
VVDLDEFFGVARVVIFVVRSRLERIQPGNLPERWGQSTERTLPDGVTSLTGERVEGLVTVPCDTSDRQ